MRRQSFVKNDAEIVPAAYLNLPWRISNDKADQDDR